MLPMLRHLCGCAGLQWGTNVAYVSTEHTSSFLAVVSGRMPLVYSVEYCKHEPDMLYKLQTIICVSILIAAYLTI